MAVQFIAFVDWINGQLAVAKVGCDQLVNDGGRGAVRPDALAQLACLVP